MGELGWVSDQVLPQNYHLRYIGPVLCVSRCNLTLSPGDQDDEQGAGEEHGGSAEQGQGRDTGYTSHCRHHCTIFCSTAARCFIPLPAALPSLPLPPARHAPGF